MSLSSRLGLALLALAAPGALAPGALAQGAPDADDGPGLRFNGLGRAYIQQSELGGALADTDTTTAGQLSNGNFVLDLAVNAQPNRVTEVQGTIRLRNELGGFFGAGATVEIRELWARGVIADAVRYRIGDMDLAMSPYTLFLPEEDAVVNEPELFIPQREVIDYEEFYTGENTRRIQGANVDFGLAFDQGVDEVETRAFIGRLRATNFGDIPTRLITGGRLGAVSAPVGPVGSQLTAGLNLVHVWDDLQSGDANAGIRNSVLTLDADAALFRDDGLAIHLRGEGGRSFADFRERIEEEDPDAEPDPDGEPDPDAEPVIVTRTEQDVRVTDTFFEIGLAAMLDGPGIGLTADFVDVGPEFYSVAAQSKRVDYTRELESFNRLGNDRDERAVSLFDLTRDPGLYTFRIGNPQAGETPVPDVLMAYDPRYSNVLPYGRATPNRRGVRLGATYGGGIADDANDASPVGAELELALLREIRGQGTERLKDFVLLRAGTDVAVGQLAGLGRAVGVTLGAQLESTRRDGDEFETVDLTSVLFEGGLSAEVYDRLDLLVGAKLRSSSGSDYRPVIEDFNDVFDFPERFVTDDREALVGTGLRYRFRDDVYLTVQVQSFGYSRDDAPESDYRVGQVFALYSMTF